MTFVDHPQRIQLNDGRLRLRHGPIELVIEAFGSRGEVENAYRQAIESFNHVLSDLVAELDQLKEPYKPTVSSTQDTYPKSIRKHETLKPAASMVHTAVVFSSDHIVTPMIAVAGAVADHILACMIDGRTLSRAYVNNGGDIALHLSGDECFDIGVCRNPVDANISSKAHITQGSHVHGVATSGWRGRSHSMGIADAVTVLAHNSAFADAAATLIANAVDLQGHANIKRRPASELSPDSDLGQRLVTVDVGKLSSEESQRALANGMGCAQKMIEDKLITSVYATLNKEMFTLNAEQVLSA